MQATIEKLVVENKLSEQEGQKLVADLLKSGEAKRADLEKQFKSLSDDLQRRVGLKGEAPPAAKTRPVTKESASRPVTKATGAPKHAANKGKAGAAKASQSANAKTSAAKQENKKA